MNDYDIEKNIGSWPTATAIISLIISLVYSHYAHSGENPIEYAITVFITAFGILIVIVASYVVLLAMSKYLDDRLGNTVYWLIAASGIILIFFTYSSEPRVDPQYNEGYEAGKEAGYEEGYTDGENEGWQEGYDYCIEEFDL